MTKKRKNEDLLWKKMEFGDALDIYLYKTSKMLNNEK